MSTVLRIILIAVSFFTVIFFVIQIRKSKMQIKDAIFWFIFSISIFCISIFPIIAYKVTQLIGVISPVNFIFLFVIFVMILKLFRMTIRISQLEIKLKELVQKIAIDQTMKDKK